MTVQGIQVEPKEDIVKRLGRSPDCGEALKQTIPESPAWPSQRPSGGTAKLGAIPIRS